MATRSCIAVRTGTARKPRYLAVYCHWDGYPDHQLPILAQHHNSSAKALALIAPGDISALRTGSTWQSGAPRSPQPLYYAERGDKDIAPREFTKVQQLLDHFQGMGCEHAYVFTPKLGWVHTDLRQLDLPFEDPDPEDPNWVGSPIHY